MFIFPGLCLCCVIGAQSAPEQVSSCCDNTPYHMVLYKQTNTRWQQALDTCQDLGQDLVSIRDRDTQDMVQQWLSGLDTRPDTVWTSGHQSHDTTWRYLDDTAYTGSPCVVNI